MTTIDFSDLLRKEKQKARKQRKEETDARLQSSRTEVDEKAQGKDAKSLEESFVPLWEQPIGSLAFERLELKTICKDPKTIYYSSRALVDSKLLETWLDSLPSGDSGLSEWKTMNYGKRRVAMFGETYPDLPPPLDEIAKQLVKYKIFPASEPPNHVLCNDYQPSQGILPHTDGPLYASRTATLSLSSSVVVEFTKRLLSEEIGTAKQTIQSKLQVLLEAGSLLVFEDDAYMDYCHGIPMSVWQDETTQQCLNAEPYQIIPRGHRYSLTFRHKIQPV